jgi:hypothetical protein
VYEITDSESRAVRPVGKMNKETTP